VTKTVGESSTEEQTFYEKMDIGLVTPGQFQAMIDDAADSPRVVLCGVGKPGVGKSQSVYQCGKRRSAPVIVLHIPQMSIEDFHIPTNPSDPGDRRFYDKRIPRKFQVLFEYLAQFKDGSVPVERRPIILVEEPNRAREKSVTTACFTLFEDRIIGDQRIPDEVQIVTLMNPGGGGASVNSFEKDTAARRRLSFVGVTYSYGEFMEHAIKNGFHEKVSEFLEAQPSMVYDDDAASAGKVFACPASWETVSSICKRYDAGKTPFSTARAEAMIASKLGMTTAKRFIDFVENKVSIITPKQILEQYKDKSRVRAQIKKQIEDGRTDALAEECKNLAIYLFRDKRAPKSYGDELALFMADLPDDVLVAFISQYLAGESKASNENRTYFTKMNEDLAGNKMFNDAMRRQQETKRKMQEAMAKKKEV